MNIYGFSPVSGACHWYRIRLPLYALTGLGHTTEFGDTLSEDIVRRHDTILCHMLHDKQASDAWLWLNEAGQHRLIYDIDDNIWAWESGTKHHAYWTPERLSIAERNMGLAHLITTPSAELAGVIRRRNLNPNVIVLPNYVPRFVLDIPVTRPEHFTVGYQGAPQDIHQSDLDSIQVPLFNFLAECDQARLLFFGQPEPLLGAGPFADRIDYVPWNPVVPDYYRSLHRMTVGIGPLHRSPFTACKSGIRAIELTSLGIPGIYSDGPAYRPFVAHNVTGFLARAPHSWYKWLTKLYQQPELVAKMSEAARSRARTWEEWTIEKNAVLWQAAYEKSGPDLAASSTLGSNAHSS